MALEVTGAGSTPITVTGEQRNRRWLDMAAGAPLPTDWSPESNIRPTGGILVQPTDVTDAWGTQPFHWSDDGSTLKSDDPVWGGKYRLIAKTRDGYIVAKYSFDDTFSELRVWTDIGPAR
ncbi:hypothetical protein J2X20_003710 [Pelomonas saccharophila]|uniref:Uncharacterized protein n=1 Tax=Roseateles saccharophilus TaxID=304 RepID=A0ABU1YQB3_ROSSA|nr:hypothetical protein [Roseateles saccharophilus]MDR7271052.1 hypothetical protein [Roseateles saccharophilus]